MGVGVRSFFLSCKQTQSAMITKVKDQKKASPLIGILLFGISIFLMIVTGPVGLLIGLLYNLFKRSLAGIGEYCMKMAISIDQLGNVVMRHLFNGLLITRESKNKFGDPDETISSVIGKNANVNPVTLSMLGKALNAFLNLIDPGHTFDSIEYTVEDRKI